VVVKTKTKEDGVARASGASVVSSVARANDIVLYVVIARVVSSVVASADVIQNN
jgi:hypothetical protein